VAKLVDARKYLFLDETDRQT